MPLSLRELLALVPKAKRGNKASVVAALYAVGAFDGATSRPTKDVPDLLALHLKGKAPANPSDALAKAALRRA